MELIDWRVLFEEDMKIPGFKEEFDRDYEDFRKQNAAELAAERRAAKCPRSLFVRTKIKHTPPPFTVKTRKTAVA